MFFKKKKKDTLVLNNVGSITHLILNGVDMSNYVTEYKITQEGGCKPKITIVCCPANVDILIEELKNIKIKVEK